MKIYARGGNDSLVYEKKKKHKQNKHMAAAAAARSTTATKLAFSAKEDGKARFGYSLGY